MWQLQDQDIFRRSRLENLDSRILREPAKEPFGPFNAHFSKSQNTRKAFKRWEKLTSHQYTYIGYGEQIHRALIKLAFTLFCLNI